VFAEVKARHVRRESSGAQRYEERTLGWPRMRQFQRQRQAVQTWLAEQGSDWPQASCRRLDVVVVLFDEHETFVRLDHIQAAWEGAW
jgi:Holliday junction resolvase-like predicted endonuclease